MDGIDVIGIDENLASRRAVAVMFGEVKYHRAPRDLHIFRETGLELMLPVDDKAEPLDIKCLGERNIENSNNGDARLERWSIISGSASELELRIS